MRKFVMTLSVLGATGAFLGCNKAEPVAPTGPVPGEKSPAGQLMAKIGGPGGLQMQLDQELRNDPPAWDSIQQKTSEYEKLAGEVAKFEPTKGSKDSWDKLTAAFADTAKKLNQSAQAKDLPATREAQKSLGASCNGCHREHRGPGAGPKGKAGPPA